MLVSIVDTDGLVLKHQGISSGSADYAPMHFSVFKGYHIESETKQLPFCISKCIFFSENV